MRWVQALGTRCRVCSVCSNERALSRAYICAIAARSFTRNFWFCNSKRKMTWKKLEECRCHHNRFGACIVACKVQSACTRSGVCTVCLSSGMKDEVNGTSIIRCDTHTQTPKHKQHSCSELTMFGGRDFICTHLHANCFCNLLHSCIAHPRFQTWRHVLSFLIAYFSRVASISMASMGDSFLHVPFGVESTTTTRAAFLVLLVSSANFAHFWDIPFWSRINLNRKNEKINNIVVISLTNALDAHNIWMCVHTANATRDKNSCGRVSARCEIFNQKI